MNKKLFLYVILGLFLLAVPGVTAAHAEGMNPCNPCSKKIPNPCNPCNAKRMNPCNPCNKKMSNPCNPCGKGAWNPCNPCYTENPCNPCNKKMSNPCNPCNPCNMKRMKKMNPCNPCNTKMSNPCNPCNPCNQADIKPIRSEHFKSRKELLALGEKLWNDENLGESGLACMTCHEDHESLNLDRFNTWRWPHYVDMPKDVMTLDQMINFCIMNPIDGTPFEFGSYKMTAMAVFYSDYVRKYHGPTTSGTKTKKAAMNPCNPCGK